MEGTSDPGSAPGKGKSTPQGKKPPPGQGGGKQNKKSVSAFNASHSRLSWRDFKQSGNIFDIGTVGVFSIQMFENVQLSNDLVFKLHP